MNINTFHTNLLAALGDSTGANDINEFRSKYVTAITALQAQAADANIEAVIAAKTEIAALNGSSSAADIVTALQA